MANRNNCLLSVGKKSVENQIKCKFKRKNRLSNSANKEEIYTLFAVCL